MKRRYYFIIIIAVVIVAVAGVFYIHFYNTETADQKTGIPKSQSVVDLRPLLAEKLKQLVKNGSNGLYNLSLEKLVPDIVNGELDIYNATLIPDSSVLTKLDSAQKAPDDIFKISFHELHINGITLQDVIKRDRIELDSVFIKDPVIEAYHNPRPYNKGENETDSSRTLYKRLMKQVKSISINAISVEHGTFSTIDLSKKKDKKIFNYVSMHISKLLIDSTTQYDKDRFLFAKKAELSCKDYTTKTRDSLYLFKIGYLTVQAQQHTMVAEDVSLTPRGNKEEFEKKLSHRDDRYDMHFPKVIFRDVDWWSFANNEHFFSKEGEIYDAIISDYIDRSMPLPAKIKQDEFASQLLMRIPVKININNVKIHDLKVNYEAYNPASSQGSKVYFDKINGVLRNITNMPDVIKRKSNLKFSGSCLFMGKIPSTVNFQFDLSKFKTGDFSVDLHMSTMDKTVLNPFTKPLALFQVKSGSMQEGIAHVEGNNFAAKAKVMMLYQDLHITPLKKDDHDSLKKKTVTNLIANIFLIKNDNPSKGEPPRDPEVVVERKGSDGYFNLVWTAVLTGILKTIGIPEKYAEKR